MNGEPLPQAHGFPVRLIVPGRYGIANVKWLQRIEVLPTRYENRFMARDYVTIREQQVNGQSVWTETSVGRALLKSVPGKVTRAGGQYRIVGAQDEAIAPGSRTSGPRYGCCAGSSAPAGWPLCQCAGGRCLVEGYRSKRAQSRERTRFRPATLAIEGGVPFWRRGRVAGDVHHGGAP